ncbi:hypothetical protein Mp_4g05390 [Marchantia polymorpha subsp. ruderalis]|uniref:Uncharacterized protein n=2 Tax=Marchantia polymorpha TaxID=3197 RepID=A0AAF6B6M1_MARPO|nr:hypothetical protein MARPO_0087s0051 [Marchantia polymorpha]BBN07655.1 hypothetical protein Mp_4g05390 [Marchantia polymorpha subsp. ruderalis]|eukprot:PTQ33617.1 hypothetical protein MARPO_0087s0051 [Marchantia polymorpha]
MEEWRNGGKDGPTDRRTAAATTDRPTDRPAQSAFRLAAACGWRLRRRKEWRDCWTLGWASGDLSARRFNFPLLGSGAGKALSFPRRVNTPTGRQAESEGKGRKGKGKAREGKEHGGRGVRGSYRGTWGWISWDGEVRARCGKIDNPNRYPASFRSDSVWRAELERARNLTEFCGGRGGGGVRVAEGGGERKEGRKGRREGGRERERGVRRGDTRMMIRWMDLMV